MGPCFTESSAATYRAQVNCPHPLSLTLGEEGDGVTFCDIIKGRDVLKRPPCILQICHATPRCNDCKKCPYGTLFTPRLLTLHDASVYSSQRIGRPFLPTRAKYIISHILSDLQKEEIRTYQKKTESVGGKNICSNLANENEDKPRVESSLLELYRGANQRTKRE